MAELVIPLESIYSPLCSSIFINLREDGHGCSNNCSFCVWKKTNFIYDYFSSTFIVPTDKDIEDFFKYSRRKCVTLSGGGEPLYEFTKNKDVLKRIVDKLHSMGREIELITRDYNTLVSNFDEINSMFDKFSFSIGACDPKITNIMEKIGRERVRVSYITDGTSEDLSYADKLFNFYKPYIRKFYLKENYMNPMKKEEFNASKKFCEERDIFFGSINDYELILIGNKIGTTKWINDIFRKEFNNGTL